MDKFNYDITYLERFDFYWISYFGNPDLVEFSSVNSKLVRHPDFEVSKDLFLDMRQASLVNITNEDFRRMRNYMSRVKGRDKRKQATVVRNKLDYGLHRMFASHLEDPIIEQRMVFESVEEALGWLRPEEVSSMREELGDRY